MQHEPWPTVAIAHSRLLRPYSTRKLSDALYHVNTAANGIHQRELALLIETPVQPEEWLFALGEIKTDLHVLTDYCRDAWRRLSELERSAHGDYDRALQAMVAVLRGLSEAPGGDGSGEVPEAVSGAAVAS